MKLFNLRPEEYETMLLEMATDRKNAHILIRGLGKQIFLHLIKVIKWEDDINYNKHIADIDNWIYNIQSIKYKPKNKRFSNRQYYQWMYDDLFGDIEDMKVFLKQYLSNYVNLPEKMSNFELITKLKEIYKQLTYDISKGKFDGIESYLK